MTKTVEAEIAELRTTLKLYLEHNEKCVSQVSDDMKDLNRRVTDLEHWETRTKTGYTALGVAFGAGGVVSQALSKFFGFIGS